MHYVYDNSGVDLNIILHNVKRYNLEKEEKKDLGLGRFWYDLEVKTHELNRNNKRTEIEQFDWFIERIQTRLAFGRLSERLDEKTSCLELSRNQSILCFDVILQHDWPIEQCLPPY